MNTDSLDQDDAAARSASGPADVEILLRGGDGLAYDEASAGYANHSAAGTIAAESLVVPVIEEQIEIGTRQVETGRVRITKTVHTHEETIDEPILREQVVVEHVPIGRPVTEAPAVRYENNGDVMIVPVLEEVLVVTKQLVLKEELRITRTQTEQRDPQTVTLRTEEIAVERIASNQP